MFHTAVTVTLRQESPVDEVIQINRSMGHSMNTRNAVAGMLSFWRFAAANAESCVPTFPKAFGIRQTLDA